MVKKSANKKKCQELCEIEEEHKKNLDKIEVMNEEDLKEFMKDAKVEEEFEF